VFTDVIEAAASVVTANFTTLLTALAAAKGVTLDPTITVYKRQNANLFAALKTTTLPGVGIYGLGAQTNARRQDLRDSSVLTVFDYFARGPDPAALLVQGELAAEVLLMCIDRLGGSAVGVYGAGEATLSVQVSIAPAVRAAGETYYEENVLVQFLVDERDTGLS